jgi:hypothetical protein
MMPDNISKKIKTCHASLSNRSFEATSSVQCAGMIRVLPLAGSGRAHRKFRASILYLDPCMPVPSGQKIRSTFQHTRFLFGIPKGSNGFRVVFVGGRGNCSWS